MSRITDKEELLSIIEKDKEFINKIDGSSCAWGQVQGNDPDDKLGRCFGNFFDFAKSGTLEEVAKKIKESTSLTNPLKMYSMVRALTIRNAWLDESLIGTFSGVELCPNDNDYWDFEYKGIRWDLKSSQAPRKFDKFKSYDEISANGEDFIRTMFLEASKGKRANPAYHKESNRFFMVYRSFKDKDYYDRNGSTINTVILKSNFNVKENAFKHIFDNFSEENVFHLKDVKYYWKNNYGVLKEYNYDDVWSFICLVSEMEDGEVKVEMLKNSN